MNSIQSLVVIGSGNVATHLAPAFKDAGLDILGIYSRTFKNSKILADKLNANTYESITEIPDSADAYLLAVSDSALTKIVGEMPIVDGILMHTSGSVGLDVFSENIKRAAVFYPLQTFSKEKPLDFSNVPILIESKDKMVFKQLENLGGKISQTVKFIDSKQRKQLHLAAVFASNFSNYMYYIAFDLLKENKLNFELLKPLISETIEKLDTLSPQKAQTGPAIRHDSKTMNAHFEMLNTHPEYQQIYRLISDQIQKLKL